MKISSKVILGFSILAISSVPVLWAQSNTAPMDHMQMASTINKAIAVIHPTKGNTVSGTVTFTKTPDGIRVVANLSGLTQGSHGIHIHEFGDCSSDDGSSAGGHFNPTMMAHGGPNSAIRHEGDMGNITADASGHATLDYTDKSLSFQGNNSIIGRSVVVHAKADDLKTQPSGDSGSRIGCGVIGIAK